MSDLISFVDSPDYMSYITKAHMATRAEVLSSADWEIKFDHIPNAVFWPGELTFEMRAKSVQAPVDLSIINDKVYLRGVELLQPGMIVHSGQITVDLQDLADQNIVSFLVDYFYKAQNPTTLQSLLKEDLYADISLYRLNSSRKAVKALRCKTCLPTAGNLGDAYTNNNEKAPLQGHLITWDVQLYWYEVLNT